MFRAGFSGPEGGYFRLIRMVTVTAITIEIPIRTLIIDLSFLPGRNFPGLQQTGRGSGPGHLGSSLSNDSTPFENLT
jgi:hypothetical protein